MPPQHANQWKVWAEYFPPATASVFLRQKHPVVYVAIIPCDMGSQGERIGGLGEKDRGWQVCKRERGRQTEKEKTGHLEALSIFLAEIRLCQANAPMCISLKSPLKRCNKMRGSLGQTSFNLFSSFDPLRFVASYYLNFQRWLAKHRLKWHRKGTLLILELLSVRATAWEFTSSRLGKGSVCSDSRVWCWCHGSLR